MGLSFEQEQEQELELERELEREREREPEREPEQELERMKTIPAIATDNEINPPASESGSAKANRIAFACRLPAATLSTIKREAAAKGISEANVIVGWAAAAECQVYVVDATGIDASKLRNASMMTGTEISRAATAQDGLRTASKELKAETELRNRRAGAKPIPRPGEK